jgi:hypothetical protein
MKISERDSWCLSVSTTCVKLIEKIFDVVRIWKEKEKKGRKEEPILKLENYFTISENFGQSNKFTTNSLEVCNFVKK